MAVFCLLVDSKCSINVYGTNDLLNKYVRDFPVSPVIQNLLSNAGETDLIPGWELRSHMLWGCNY